MRSPIACEAARWRTLSAAGFEGVSENPATIKRTGIRAFLRSLGILWTCLREAPELATHKRRKALAHKNA